MPAVSVRPVRVRVGTRRRLVWLAIGALIATAATMVWHETVSITSAPTRSELQRILDDLVIGRTRVAPGVTAYVSGPHGTWVGSAGLANVTTGEPIRPDARMHLDSNSKAWTATLILQLVGEGRLRLDDTVDRWLPGLLPYGNQITVRELLNHTSGLIDSNDITADPTHYISQVRDAALRAELLHVWRQEQADPTFQALPILEVRFAAALPLLSLPGTTYHYSNIGYEVAGLIAAKVSDKPLADLYRQRIIDPLRLTRATYKPQGEISGPHPHEYSIRPNGKLADATGWYRLGNGASAGIVSDAADEARFLTALMQGKLLRSAQLAAMLTPAVASGRYGLGVEIRESNCAGVAYQHGGGSYSTTSSTFVSGDGKRVAVVLLNGNTLDSAGILDTRAATAAVAAANRIYCAA